MGLQSYKDLIVWQKSIELTVEIYRLTALYPKSEAIGLVSQSRRAAVAIPSNIAEGFCRKSQKEFSRFVNIAFASAAELETQLIIAKRLKFANRDECQKLDLLLLEIQKMLYSLEKKICS